MTQHNVNQVEQTDRPKAVSPSTVGNKEFSVTGLTVTRGKPSKLTNPKLIGEDGKIDYFIVDTDVELDEEGATSFFGTSAIQSQVNRFAPNVQELFAQGDKFGPVKLGKKDSKKTTGKYWCLIFPNEEGY
jgi:hypothetical protein